MHDLREKGYGDEVELFLVLLKVLLGLHARFGLDSRQGFEALSRKDGRKDCHCVIKSWFLVDFWQKI